MPTKIILSLIFLTILFACKEEAETDPRIETSVVKSPASHTCYAKATVIEKGSYELIDYGFVYSPYNGNFGIESGAPKISLGTIPMVADTFSTSFALGEGSNYSTTYYVRAYYTNKKGTVYGSALVIKPLIMSIVSVIPNAGKAGDRIIITGSNFGKKPTDNVVKFNNIVASVIEASSTSLTVEVPTGIVPEYYNANVLITVKVGGITFNWNGFTLSPAVTGFSPTSGTFGTTVKITGSNLYDTQIKLNNTVYYTNYNNSNSIQFNIPNNIKTSKISISIVKNGVETAIPGEFTMTPCSISSVSPAKAITGTQVTITGGGFNPDSYSNIIKIGGEKITNYWIANTGSINMIIPETLKSGTYDITINNGIEDAVFPKAFTVIQPQLTGFSPASGQYGSDITIFGKNLSTLQYIGFGKVGYQTSRAEIISRDSLQIVVKVPTNIATGSTKIWATVGNQNITCTDEFTILPPVITDFSPSEGTPGTIVTIKGTGFDFTAYNTSVKFGTIASSIVSVSQTEIKAVVPSDAPVGLMKLLITSPWYIVSTDTDFTVKK